MNDLPSFAAEVIPLVSRDEPFSFDGFLARVTAEVFDAFTQIEEADGDLAPMLIVANEGECAAITWRDVAPELDEHFLTHVVPATLAPHDLSMVALAITSYMRPQDSDSPADDRQEVMLVNVLALAEENQAKELTLAASIERSADAPPRLGIFERVSTGLAPAFARPLYRGLLSELQPHDQTAEE